MFNMTNIENIVIFAADSLRWDYLPEELANDGVTFKTVAQSTYSPPSFATLSTGLYPPQHGVHHWTNGISDEISSIYDIEGVESGFYQDESAGETMFDVLGVESSTELETLSPPFVYLERDLTPHLPFDDQFEQSADSAQQYFKTRDGDWDRMRDEYRRCCEYSVDKLNERIEYLREADLLDSTLVIFTSDHGELLGEYGDASHTSPACPELVYVPTVFMHPDLSESDFLVDTNHNIIEHVDVIETAMSIAGHQSMRTEGVNLLDSRRPRDFGFTNVKAQRKGRPFYESDSLWWYDSGHAFALNSRIVRLMYLAYRLTFGLEKYAIRHDIPELFKKYFDSYNEYGDPPLDAQQSKQRIDQLKEQLQKWEPVDYQLSEDQKESLQDLGYLE